MTQDIKRILYATDLSDNSTYAFGYAINLAKKFNAEITILHVIDIMMGISVNMVGVYFNEKQLEENLQKRITHVTEEINNRLKIFINEKVVDANSRIASLTHFMSVFDQPDNTDTNKPSGDTKES